MNNRFERQFAERMKSNYEPGTRLELIRVYSYQPISHAQSLRLTKKLSDSKADA